MHDLIIVGGGAAALSAAVYAKRFNLDFIVIAEHLGGTATQAWVVDNYLGFQHIMGVDIANKFAYLMQCKTRAGPYGPGYLPEI